MCLNVVTRKRRRPNLLEGFGWKVMRRTKTQRPQRLYFSSIKTYNPSGVLPGVRLKAHRGTLKTWTPEGLNPQNYSSGFHLFTSRFAAYKWRDMCFSKYPSDYYYYIVTKAQFWGGRTEGEQEDLKIIVADEIMFL